MEFLSVGDPPEFDIETMNFLFLIISNATVKTVPDELIVFYGTYPNKLLLISLYEIIIISDMLEKEFPEIII